MVGSGSFTQAFEATMKMRTINLYFDGGRTLVRPLDRATKMVLQARAAETAFPCRWIDDSLECDALDVDHLVAEA